MKMKRDERLVRQSTYEFYLDEGYTIGQPNSASALVANWCGVTKRSINRWLEAELALKNAGEENFYPRSKVSKEQAAQVEAAGFVLPPGSDGWREPYVHPKPRIRVKAVTREITDEPIHTVLAIGDSHTAPGRDTTRFNWFGKFANHVKADYVVHIGDIANFDSMSTHDTPGSRGDFERPTFVQDLENLEEALYRFDQGLSGQDIPLYITLGNHCDRLWRAANQSPKSQSDAPERLTKILERFKWKWYKYGQTLTLCGVDFVHTPLNVMGRAMGGINADANIARNAIRSTVYGHTHKMSFYTSPRIGHDSYDGQPLGRAIQIVNLGTSMPQGFTEHYKGLSLSGWSYGVAVLRIRAGQIIGFKFYDMLELEEMFGGV